MITQRHSAIKNSNNKSNPNKNICSNAVATALGVAGGVRYLHFMCDLKKAASKKFQLRSRLAQAKVAVTGSRNTNKVDITVDQLKQVCADLTAKSRADEWEAEVDNETLLSGKWNKQFFGYIVHVDGHVLLLDEDGTVVRDTAPEAGVDNRKVMGVFGIAAKPTENRTFTLNN